MSLIHNVIESWKKMLGQKKIVELTGKTANEHKLSSPRQGPIYVKIPNKIRRRMLRSKD